MVTTGPEPGWYVDPDGAEGQQRYWNGAEWTEHRTVGLPKPAPVPVQIVKPKRGPLPKPAIIAIAVVFLAALTWFIFEMQQQNREKIEDFRELERQREQNLDNFGDNLRDACMRNPSECGAG